LVLWSTYIALSCEEITEVTTVAAAPGTTTDQEQQQQAAETFLAGRGG